MVELVFPTLDGDESDALGLMSNWFVADGARVTIGDLLATVEGHRAVGEITAPVTGVLRHSVPAGTRVEQGAVVGVLHQG
jgi:pyruvate/2-oxoglutarate dehydrogenase complex dihydrolipoamide acyltransferase (E2) component